MMSYLRKYFRINKVKNNGGSMKTQTYNKGELKELKVMIEKETLESFERMAKNTKTPIQDLIVIAMKRFRSSHGDFDPNSSHHKN